MVVMAPVRTSATSLSAGGRLVASDGRELPLRSVHLAAEAAGGIARVVLTQRFANPYAEPLEVRYLLPLPADGAVSGFSFVLGDERVTGEVTGKQEARQRFQQAMAQGRTAALLEQDRTSLFTQRVGNVPPRTEVVAEVIVDQPLRWLDEGAWEWRFPTVVGARYQGAPGRVADAAKLQVPVAAGELSVRATFALRIGDALTGVVASPSHAVQSRGQGPVEVRLEGDSSARLDRDVVVRWPVALPDVSANVIAARPDTAAHDGDAFALLTVAPPTGGWTAVARDLTFLIDTSGSMGGRPLDQARSVARAMIETLGVRDRIEMIEFGDRPRPWQAAPVLATESNKAAALQWLAKLQSSGSTEMHRAVIEALRPLRDDSQRQVVLITDGFIGFEQEIVKTILRELPAGARLHTVGVGSSVNRSLTQAAARAGRGTELIVGVDEDAAQVVGRLVARTTAPLVTDLAITGEGLLEVAPRQLPDLYAEAPALIAVRVKAGARELVVRGRTADGPFERRLSLPALERGQGPLGVAALFAREKVEDLETVLGAGGHARELNASIEATGIAFQIATRLTSWIAVSEKVTVAPKTRARKVEQPHELPHGVSAEGLGLRKSGEAALRNFGQVNLKEIEKKLEERGLRLGNEAIDEVLRRADEKSERPAKTEEFQSKLGEIRDLLGSSEEMGIAESSDELILEDSTSNTVINIGDVMGGARSGSKQEIVFDTTEEYADDERVSLRGFHDGDETEALETEAFELMDESGETETDGVAFDRALRGAMRGGAFFASSGPADAPVEEPGSGLEGAAPEQAKRISTRRVVSADIPDDDDLTRAGRGGGSTKMSRAASGGPPVQARSATTSRGLLFLLLLALIVGALILAWLGGWVG